MELTLSLLHRTCSNYLRTHSAINNCRVARVMKGVVAVQFRYL